MRLTAICGALLAGAMLTAAVPARACLFAMEIPKDEAARIATTGYVVRARVIRGYDAAKRQPELLQIENVFVGGSLPSVVELVRDDQFYRTHTEEFMMADCLDAFRVPQEIPVLLILFPASPASDDQPARFSVGQYVGWARPSDIRQLYAPVVRAARQTRRLRAIPG